MYRAAVYKYIIRPLYSLLGRRKIDEEMFEDSEIWRDCLFGVVPVNRLSEAWLAACHSQPGSFAPTYFDVKNKWLEIEAKEARRRDEARESDPVRSCSHFDQHHPKSKAHEGRILALSPFSGEDELMPCPHCRASDHEGWRKTQSALYGRHKPLPVPITPAAAVEALTHPKTVYLTPAAAKEIRDEYNDLVNKLVEDKGARKSLFVIFDEGANVFRHPHRVDVVYSEKVMRDKIERYKKVLEERGK